MTRENISLDILNIGMFEIKIKYYLIYTIIATCYRYSTKSIFKLLISMNQNFKFIDRLSSADMVLRKLICFLILFVSVGCNSVPDYARAFDPELYERVLDSKECQRQLDFLSNRSLGLSFIDASAKIPSGILTGNVNDFGDYDECLGIHDYVEGMELQGKYCTVLVPWDQMPTNLPETLEDNWLQLFLTYQFRGISGMLEQNKGYAHEVSSIRGRIDPNEHTVFVLSSNETLLGLCIPKVCTTSEALNHVLNYISFVNLTYRDYYCRLPNDKPFRPADYVSMAIFSIIAILTVASSSYEIYNVHVLKKDSSQLHPIYRNFSVFHNTRRFLTFNRNSGQLDCLDGIRVMAMSWITLGHTFSMIIFAFTHNSIYKVIKFRQLETNVIFGAILSVDTFLSISGLLLVYTVVGKIPRDRFLKGIPLFYLYRLLRIWPLLAATLLLEVSLMHHIADGPFWQVVAGDVENCRSNWWRILLHVQNYYRSNCMIHTWYLAVDFQLYILSPIVIVWLFGRKAIAWLILILSVLLSWAVTITYSYTFKMSTILHNFERSADIVTYLDKFYDNTLPRAVPFVVGMMFGYILHLHRDKKLTISRLYVSLFWIYSCIVMFFAVYSLYPMAQSGYDNQAFDSFYNAFARILWAFMIGWLVLACDHGYAGPINWFLSLKIWKIPARLSFAVYLIHLPLLMIFHGSWKETHYFGGTETFFRYLNNLCVTILVAFAMCIVIDAPCSTLQKMLLGIKSNTQNSSNEEPQETVEDGKSFKTTL
ncbi:nose resistant to fluoxetine protein 6-like [Bombyx mandarina]|uniref:Nose resistant to fluoxetine protein 6-like n=1 Tax=Bombyx mandarina TaxID=7092 RepID=A0A6J2JT81_BOMMA|nr:nose resistant to fluoxetine protein 6-like [Bombyx mandarina]